MRNVVEFFEVGEVKRFSWFPDWIPKVLKRVRKILQNECVTIKFGAISNSPLLGRDHARVLQAGVRAFGGPFAAVSTTTYIRTFRF